ncbi:hypothetical protein DC498_09045 [Terrimonas sp.]|uniref:hypothetical protein n=1 Tax=Terrimonas sp. TaxID=1914338 RepID=UPI000D50A510|nr:hypothetical protein [Terrimonas sp.]PVD52650.1 hypothetical protein DC498_09045 [Terrimonas sp.]
MNTIDKIKGKLRHRLVRIMRYTFLYPYIYRSYWHSLFFKGDSTSDNQYFYFSAKPNIGAGIGHQLANWIAGYWFARQFGLKFAHLPFSSDKWEAFLGFGENETDAATLFQSGYQSVRLPLFHEFNEKEVGGIKKIIQSYSNKKVVFVAEQDQFYKAQFGVIKEIQNKFYSATARQHDKLSFKPGDYNIAIHVRRGDIVTESINRIPNKSLRFQGNDYFVKVLENTIQNIKTSKPISVYLFSQGTVKDFSDFNQFSNIRFCLEMNAIDSFNHMVHADALITSKSSFSYKAALLNRGLKICPENFWHGYPQSEEWILTDDDGNILSI